MEIKEITLGTFTSVADLIDFSDTLSALQFNHWAFRGQPKSYGTLVPSFQRQFDKKSYGTAEVIEIKLIEAFRDHYAKLTGKTYDMPDIARIQPGFDLRCLSVMQHYEIPTRLLDWSSNIWTSVYFACASDPGNNAELWYYHRSIFEKQQLNDAMIYGLLDKSLNPPQEPYLLKRLNPDIVFELDPQITPRMREQHGHHTVSTDVFADHVPLMYALMKECESNHPLQGHLFGRIVIEGACKGRVLQYLADVRGINAGTIFPDVVGLGRFLRWQFESLRTMMM